MNNSIFTSCVESFIKDNQEKMYRIAYSYMKNREDALDVVHDAVVKMLIHKSSLRNMEYLGTWFYRILINEALMQLRRKKRITGSADELPIISTDTDNPVGQEEYIDLYEAMDKLEPKYKTIIILKYFEGLKFNEISKILGVNENTVKSRLYKALRELKLELIDE